MLLQFKLLLLCNMQALLSGTQALCNALHKHIGCWHLIMLLPELCVTQMLCHDAGV